MEGSQMLKLLKNGKIYNPELILFYVDGTLVDGTHRYNSLNKARYEAFTELA
ncbi:hypothetical protein ACFL0D_03105 [Thermoproteota archaeon]